MADERTLPGGDPENELNKIALAISGTGTFRWMLDSGELLLDDNLRGFCGLPPGDDPRSLAELLAAVHEGDRERVEATVAETVRTERDLDLTTRIRCPGGQVVWLNTKGRVVKDQAGRRLLLGACTNITPYKSVELELVHARDSADQANRAKNLFLASVSHELRTPLTAILGFSELLLDRCASNGEALRLIDVIARNGRHVTGLVGDILDFASIESGALVVESVEVQVDPLLTDLRLMFEEHARKKGIKFRLSRGNGLPRSLYTDPKRLKQVIINLVGNAVKFTPAGSVELAVDAHADPRNADLLTVEINVDDTGIGMRDDLVQRIFKPFVQGESVLARHFGGTGLGLALSRAIARRMGGDVIVARTEVGKGSTFKATLTAHRASLPVERPIPDATSPQPKIRLSGRRLLAVDDTPDTQALIREFLQPTGATVVIADSGEDAIREARTGAYDLILMDLGMPGLDGFDTLHALRASGYDRPVVVFTAHAGEVERQQAAAAGFSAFVAKPIERLAFLRTIKDVLAGREAGPNANT